MAVKKRFTSKKIAERQKKRKNFLPTLIITFLLWGVFSFIVYFVDPGSFGSILLFFFVLWFCFLFTFSILLANTRRGFIASLGLIIFLLLRFFGIGNLLNFLLISSVAVSIEFYFSKNHS